MKCQTNPIALALLALCAFVAFSQLAELSAERPANTEEDVAAIRQWIDRYCATVTAGDFEAYRAFWTDDVVWLPPNGPIQEGIEACMEHNRPYFEEYDSVEEMSVDEIQVADRFSFVRVSYTYEGTPKGQAEPLKEDGKGLFLLKRKPDGSWVSTHCIWNSNLPPSP